MQVKVWKDASEIGMVHELPSKKLRELEKQMQTKPKFDNDIELNKKVKKKRTNKLRYKNK